jgi:integrase/recombinase XerD
MTADSRLQLAEELVALDAVRGAGNTQELASTPAAIAEHYLAAEADRIAARAATTDRHAASVRLDLPQLRDLARRPARSAAAGRGSRRRRGRRLRTPPDQRRRPGGAPAAPATVRVYVSMIRALASELGLKDQAADVRVPRHEPGPPETLTDADYTNLLRVPDRRSCEGKRDHALRRVLGDCGLRSAELRRLRAQDLRRPRANARYYRLYVHGKGGREREVSVADVVKDAIDAWVRVHPLAKAAGLRDEHPLFVRLGRDGREQPEPLLAEAVYRLVNRDCLAAGIPDRLAHPHALRSYWATHLLEGGASIHEVSARLGHVDLRTTARYAAVGEHSADDLADVLDRGHQRGGRGW